MRDKLKNNELFLKININVENNLEKIYIYNICATIYKDIHTDMTVLENSEQLSEQLIFNSIDSYSLLNKNQKALLKTLLQISSDSVVLNTKKDLARILGVTNTTVSTAIAALKKHSLIFNLKYRGVIFTGCEINKSEIDKMVSIYTKKQKLKK